MERTKARVKHLLMEATAEDLKSLEAAHAVHKGLAENCLRTKSAFPDRKGYESAILLLRAIHKIRELDIEAAEGHVQSWKRCARERMDEQLFDKSARGTIDPFTGKLTAGTDESTRLLGQWMKGWSEQLDSWMQAVLILSM